MSQKSSPQQHTRSVSRMLTADIRQLFLYWLDRKGSRWLPARRDVDPLDFPYLLGDIMVVDVLRDPMRFHVRVHGTEMARRAQYDLTGKLIDTLPNAEYRAYVLDRCKHVVETAEPLHVYNSREVNGRKHDYEAIWLPFSDDGAMVTKLFCALVYRNSDQRTDGIRLEKTSAGILAGGPVILDDAKRESGERRGDFVLKPETT